ncbi:MAG: glucosaminidase domain-containing protein [Reyranella sp.]|uniref:glucosaminidase domain-containing protein n=1 Tax=Reyranella sp. TaxID=1929291 RepID=UPI001ACB49F1|nr:glucosaminidase domain-containing protein [Reyranella sp.]MBN9090106.1 glucosaminidase domain-containing protein [Reyranella sp.]
MGFPVRPAVEAGRAYAFPIVWSAVLVAGIGLQQPFPEMSTGQMLAFNVIPPAAAETRPVAAAASPDPMLTFVRHEIEVEDTVPVSAREIAGGHGRFAAPGNAVRRQIQVKAINPKTADELAGFFREASYTLTDVRQGDPVPPLKVERVPDDLNNKEGAERKALFITALLPVILEVNQRVVAEREQLLFLRDKLQSPVGLTTFERAWLEQLADRYDGSADKLDELLKRVDVVPPSMAIAQAGIESGWGTSFAARTGNALFGQIQAGGRHAVSVSWKPGTGMPQPFANVGDAADAYVSNLNTHAAYSAFRTERASMRARGETPDGYRLIGQLLRYSELGQQYVGFVRQVMREDKLTDFDKAKLSF